VSVEVARKLRRSSTDAERVLWRALRARTADGLKFRRQQPIAGYVADFACWEARVVVELDGGQHTAERDAARTAAIEANGWEVLRFWNSDVVANTEGVVSVIVAACKARVRARV
jgi:very-short-patch-repair endonuclease